MNFKIGASALAEILDKAKRAIPGKPIFPSTRFIKLTVEDGTVEAVGTDSTLFIGAKSLAETSENGCILVDPVLSQIAQRAGGVVLELRTKKDKLLISGYGDTEMNLGDDPETFPIPAREIPAHYFELSEEEISALGVSVGSKRDANLRDGSVNLISHEGMSYCLTTEMGFWMTIVALDEEVGTLPNTLLPFSYLRRATKMVDESRIGLGAGYASVEGPTAWSTFQLVAGQPYPPSAVALEEEFALEPNYQELVDALAVSTHFTASEANLCTLTLKANVLNVESGGSETGNFVRDLFVDNEKGELKAKYNAKRLMMALKNVGQANLEFVPHPAFPEFYILRVRKDNIQHLIMPLVTDREK